MFILPMNTTKSIIFFLLIFLIPLTSIGQENEDIPLPKSLKNQSENNQRKLNFVVGGNFGFQFGNYTFIDVSPHVGIYPVDFLCIGVGGTYMYMRYSNYHQSSDTHIYGFKAFIEGYVWQRLILHAEYGYTNYKLNFFDGTTENFLYSNRVGTHAILLGPGYKQTVTDRISLYCLLLFNLYEDQYTFYSNPLVRVGINVDL